MCIGERGGGGGGGGRGTGALDRVVLIWQPSSAIESIRACDVTSSLYPEMERSTSHQGGDCLFVV